ncbi:MAG TPA: DUF2071 domain-containing protein [Vicinamibacterales bacterium]|nr:DUF2071 domain-containing protein [Vicinamibacterales bacterium]
MDIQEHVDHRPWPLPTDPWILKQAWNDLLFTHWPVARDRLRELVPSHLELDIFDNEAWVSVTPFRLSDLSPRGIPALPVISSFDEINVRTYVVYNGIPGIYFFSLDANSAVAVGGASTLFHLPYYLADIRVGDDRGHVAFRSSRRRAEAVEFAARYAPAGRVFEPERNTIEYFLTERYCLYTQDSASNAYRVEIHHAPWQLQSAEVELPVNTLVDAAGLRLPSMAPLVHYARRQDVLTWSPHLLD